MNDNVIEFRQPEDRSELIRICNCSSKTWHITTTHLECSKCGSTISKERLNTELWVGK